MARIMPQSRISPCSRVVNISSSAQKAAVWHPEDEDYLVAFAWATMSLRERRPGGETERASGEKSPEDFTVRYARRGTSIRSTAWEQRHDHGCAKHYLLWSYNQQPAMTLRDAARSKNGLVM